MTKILATVGLLLSVGASAQPTCLTYTQQTGTQHVWMNDWDFVSANVTVVVETLTTVDGTTLQLPSSPQSIDLVQGGTPGKGLLLNLINTQFPGNASSTEVQAVAAQILNSPAPTVTIADGSTLPLGIPGGGTQVPVASCGTPGQLIYDPPELVNPTVTHTYEMVSSDFAPSRTIFCDNVTTEATTVCCPQNAPNGPGCTKSAPVTTITEQCNLTVQCVWLSGITPMGLPTSRHR